MTESPLRYAVLLARQEDLKQPEIAKALAVFQKIPLQDAARLARNAWGIQADNLTKEAADIFAMHLKQVGVESVVLPQGLIEDLPLAAPTKSLEFLLNGIQAHLNSIQKEILAGEQIRLIAAVGLKETLTTTVKVNVGPSTVQRAASLGLWMSGIPLTIGKSREVEQKKQTTELFFYLDLCLRKPVRRFRIDAQHFDFSCLKARMGFSAPQNFRTLVLEMIRLFPQALKNRGAQVLLDGAPVPSMGYDAIADLDRESRWLLTLDSLKNP